MKPKMYRKTKESRGSNLTNWKTDDGGGPVEGVIIGPESSVGTVATNPSSDQGNDKGLVVPQGPSVESAM